MTGTFTVEQLRPIKDGMTISRDAKMGQTTAVTFFSLGKDNTSVVKNLSTQCSQLILEIWQKRSRYQTVTVLSFLATPSAEWKRLPELFTQKLLLKRRQL